MLLYFKENLYIFSFMHTFSYKKKNLLLFFKNIICLFNYYEYLLPKKYFDNIFLQIIS